MDTGVLISKVIDGRFPDYNKVIPKNNEKILEIKLNEFKNSIERVTTVSSDRKEGLKMSISKNSVQLSVSSPNSGEGVENINAKFNSSDLNISFNSRYLIDIASHIENELIIINLKDPGSPVLIRDFADKNSFHVVMPMKI
jgi:DNA polymerase-3 subunit beta